MPANRNEFVMLQALYFHTSSEFEDYQPYALKFWHHVYAVPLVFLSEKWGQLPPEHPREF